MIMDDIAQARRALQLAKTEAAIRKAIETAPPLTAEQIERLRALLPPVQPENVIPT